MKTLYLPSSATIRVRQQFSTSLVGAWIRHDLQKPLKRCFVVFDDLLGDDVGEV